MRKKVQSYEFFKTRHVILATKTGNIVSTCYGQETGKEPMPFCGAFTTSSYKSKDF